MFHEALSPTVGQDKGVLLSQVKGISRERLRALCAGPLGLWGTRELGLIHSIWSEVRTKRVGCFGKVLCLFLRVVKAKRWWIFHGSYWVNLRQQWTPQSPSSQWDHRKWKSRGGWWDIYMGWGLRLWVFDWIGHLIPESDREDKDLPRFSPGVRKNNKPKQGGRDSHIEDVYSPPIWSRMSESVHYDNQAGKMCVSWS